MEFSVFRASVPNRVAHPYSIPTQHHHPSAQPPAFFEQSFSWTTLCVNSSGAYAGHEVESWTTSSHLWTKRAALVFTLGWSKGRHLSPEDHARRERILGWAEGYADDPEWFIQKAVAWWLRSLSKHDPDRVRAFVDAHGPRMKAFARKEALRLVG